VVAAAGPGMAAVDHELVGAKPAQASFLVERTRHLDGFTPRRCGMDVDLDDTGIGGHLDQVQARIGRRQVALDMDWELERSRGRFYRREQLQIVLQPLDWWHEHAQ